MRTEGGAYIAATMKRLRQFTAWQLADELQLSEENARKWMRAFVRHKLLAEAGTGPVRGRGKLPILWEWRG